jgi:amidase
MATHTFTPRHYHVAIGSHEPVLRIADGDTVVTTTADARGHDAAGQQVAERGNPQTGPFYVDGAEPGDTLAVHFDHMWPNRRTGFTSTIVAANVVDPDYTSTLPERATANWELDLEKGIARLANPETKLGRFEIPFEPMIGCFGVAPPRGQAISTATSSTHGGNMDYRGFKQGVTVYFPVFVAGALFHLGDGHAVQGDGEIVGTGVETSFDVTFTVHLLKGKKIEWPRAENEEFIMTAGNARPLDQALQHATTEMMRWLGEDYGLDPRAASHLMGQVVRYDVGNVFNPAYTVACRIAKRWLSRTAG